MNWLNKERKQNLSIAILILAIVIILGTCGACNSKSGQLAKIKPEKVVILDSTPKRYDASTHMYYYRVNRFEKGVIDHMYDIDLYEKGDTVFHRFNE